jgi:hypothetical protein
MEGIDTKDMNKRLVDAELKICKKIEDIAYVEEKHPDEVYADLLIQFSEFIEKKYLTEDYPNERSAEEKIKKTRSRNAKKTTQQKRRLNG